METTPRSLPIRGESIQLSQCILNILNNAIQSLPDGQGKVLDQIFAKTKYLGFFPDGFILSSPAGYLKK